MCRCFLRVCLARVMNKLVIETNWKSVKENKEWTDRSMSKKANNKLNTTHQSLKYSIRDEGNDENKNAR